MHQPPLPSILLQRRRRQALHVSTCPRRQRRALQISICPRRQRRAPHTSTCPGRQHWALQIFACPGRQHRALRASTCPRRQRRAPHTSTCPKRQRQAPHTSICPRRQRQALHTYTCPRRNMLLPQARHLKLPGIRLPTAQRPQHLQWVALYSRMITWRTSPARVELWCPLWMTTASTSLSTSTTTRGCHLRRQATSCTTNWRPCECMSRKISDDLCLDAVKDLCLDAIEAYCGVFYAGIGGAVSQ